MLKIKHQPIFTTALVEELYSKKDGVPIKYVCTTALGSEASCCDVFYRSDGSSHPEFGNRYFGLGMSAKGVVIRGADVVEDLDFHLGKVGEEWAYSAHRHDYVNVDQGALDGGRAYLRTTGQPTVMQVKVVNGEFIQKEND